MSYFGFLFRFLGPPLLILALLTWLDARNGRRLPASLRSVPGWLVIAAHVAVAVLYTTPWDNYLVATGVWWYDPALVTGIVLGWVPVEEYTFFVLQTLLSGLYLLVLARRLGDPPPVVRGQRLRWSAALVSGAIWAASLVLLLSGWRPGTYLALTLVWALLPITGQLAFGADLIWRHRRLVGWTLLPVTLYLCIGDAAAIGSGTWTVDPAQSTGLMVGTLPMEEAVFFFMTNTLVSFGMVLVLEKTSRLRVPASLNKAIDRWVGVRTHKEATGTRNR